MDRGIGTTRKKARKRMTADRIDELSGPYDAGLFYAEGFARKVDEAEGHGPWFCFEATWEEMVKLLQGLGFTNEQIHDAPGVGSHPKEGEPR